jgi:RHS repeat-associated protein
MSDKLGASSQVISIPKGGGALQGIGEKFSPDLHTGTGNFTVPIALPPGRNGFQPELSLVYSTGNGNGPFGLGWSLSVPGVSRQTSKGIPRYDDSSDTFVLSGAEDLVPVPTEPSGTTGYRPRTEGLFARIYHQHDAGNDYWEVRSKDGLVSCYGTPGAAGEDPAVVADPLDRTKVFTWKLACTEDPFGNRISYEYGRDLGDDGPHRFDQLYLRRIRYADYTDEAGDERYLVSVTFCYGDDPAGVCPDVGMAPDRPDAFSEYRAGFEIRTRKRCERIEVRTHADEDPLARDVGTLVRAYDFTYLDERVAAGEIDAAILPPNSVSLLSQVRVEGHDGPKTESLPPLEFDYTRFTPEERDFLPVGGSDAPPLSLANPDYELADLIGNGLPDILEMNGTLRYWRNLGDGTFDRPREMREAPAGLKLVDPGVQMIDADGDGRIDLLTTTPTFSGYFPMRFGGLWDKRSFQAYRLAPSFDLEDAEVKLVDLDGDGVTDAIRSGTSLECFFNDPKEGWNGTRRVERRVLEEFPNVSFSDPRVKLADMTGDGLQDAVIVHDGRVEYWPSLGRGDWGRRVTMKNNPRLPYGYDPKRVLVGDVDGDGCADVVYVDDGKVTLCINRSGNGFGEPIEIRGTPRVSDVDSVRLADVLGTGVGGVLWSKDADGLSQTNMFFLDFTGGTKPYLLYEMDNHRGAVTRVGYASSTRFYLEDEKRPETRWKTPLPFPVQVVSRVEVIDAISEGKLTTEYSYHHGYWDGAEREFRGFGRVDQRDTEVFEDFHASGLHAEDRPFEPVPARSFSAPTETRTWFHQGPIGDEFGDWEEADYTGEYWPDDPQVLTRPQAVADMLKALPRRARRDALRTMRGSVLRTELYALDGTERQDRLYTVTESLFGVREEAPPGLGEEERLRIFFPHALAQRTTQWERGDDPMTQFTFTDDYDAYGNPRSQIAIAFPRGRDFRVEAGPGEPYLATHTVTDYAHRDDEERYLVGRVTRTTNYEIVNDGSQDVFTMRSGILDGSATRRIIGQALNFYDGPAFEGLPFGQLGDHGVLARTETLVLTEEILHEAYETGNAVRTPSELPPYLVPGGPPAWTEEYPREFRDLVAPLAGYLYRTGGAGTGHAAGYFAITERRRYDCQDDPGNGRGLLLATRDPLGRDTTVGFDAYDLLPTGVTDPAGLTTRAAYDYRVLQPREVTDPNGNRTASTFTPLGLLESTAVMGKADEDVGDTLEAPGSRLTYDFLAFTERNQPVSVRTIRRVHHVNDTDVPLPERDVTIETVEYSDGFGRLLQTRTQAEDVAFGNAVFGDTGLPANQTLAVGEAVGQQRAVGDSPRVVVSGWQTYDNKGRVVEKYEPFFSTGYEYLSRTDASDDLFGQKATMFYDPRGQVIRTVNPDGSEQRVIFGVPEELDDPERFAPTPWETYTYDANDNAGRTHPAESASYHHHWNTPASAAVDALGRTIEAVERNRAKPEREVEPFSPIEEYRTSSTYDIRGNLLTVTDALGRVAFKHVYDLANRPLRVDNIDAGIQRTVLDAVGNAVEGRDSKGALVLHAYDLVSRPIRLWARDGAGQAITLRERTLYGDADDSGLTPAQAAAANLLGRPYRHYDEAGLLTVDNCDFKGNVLEKVRQVIGDAAILSVFDPPPPNRQVPAFRADWQPPSGTTLEQHAGGLLDATEYRTSVAYDVLNRAKLMRYPRDVDGERKELRPEYNRAGALERVELDGTTFVEHIAYDAKGQRMLIAYGNGVMTRYAYDQHTFRLSRMRTEHYTKPSPLTYRPTGVPLQDFGYAYDLAGNIVTIRDRTPGSGIPVTPLGADALDRAFTYDPLYRLLSATGRECDIPPERPPWDDRPRCVDLTKARGYAESYEYDPEGNLMRLQHQANGGAFTRELALTPNSNRLATVASGQAVFDYAYDEGGNLVRETTSRHFEWDHADRMCIFRTQTEGAEPSVHAHYLYDSTGQRVKKLVRKQGGQIEVTVYIDGMFEQHRIIHGSAAQENNTLHVMDDQSRIALVRVGSPFPDDPTPAVKFHLGDHLGSSNVVIDDAGALVNREEYAPYGETSFGSFARKRYRFTGKERDEESGLCYHGARYYAPWLARWASCDPAGAVDGTNLYQYVRGNPIRLIDATGMQANDQPFSQLPEKDRQKLGRSIEKETGCNPVTHCCSPPEPSQQPSEVNEVGSIGGRPWSYRGYDKYGPKKKEMEAVRPIIVGGAANLAQSPIGVAVMLPTILGSNDTLEIASAAEVAAGLQGLAGVAAGVAAGAAVLAARQSGGGGGAAPPPKPKDANIFVRGAGKLLGKITGERPLWSLTNEELSARLEKAQKAIDPNNRDNRATGTLYTGNMVGWLGNKEKTGELIKGLKEGTIDKSKIIEDVAGTPRAYPYDVKRTLSGYRDVTELTHILAVRGKDKRDAALHKARLEALELALKKF